MRIDVVGAGWVGTVTAACFAALGHRVHCVDVDASKVSRLRKGGARIAERVRHPVLSNPEFLREGTAIDDFMRPDRVVIGAKDPDVPSTQALKQLYDYTRIGSIIVVSRESAELSKYAANFMLATRISAINEVAELAGSTGADIEEVSRIVGTDSRIGPAFLAAGLGFGGSCFPKDVAELAVSNSAGIARAVLARNHQQRRSFLHGILDVTKPGDRVVVWGLSFKPNTSDVREAPARNIVDGLIGAGRDVAVYDPVVKELYPGRHAIDAYSCLVPHGQYSQAQPPKALVLCTEWAEFRTLDTSKLPAGLHLFDGRNVWDPVALRAQGFVYHGIGR